MAQSKFTEVTQEVKQSLAPTPTLNDSLEDAKSVANILEQAKLRFSRAQAEVNNAKAELKRAQELYTSRMGTEMSLKPDMSFKTQQQAVV